MTDLPPARADIADPDIDWDVAARTEISLNGLPCSQVVAYDCEAGWIKKHRTDEAGKLIVAPDRETLEEETLTGQVTVGWREA